MSSAVRPHSEARSWFLWKGRECFTERCFRFFFEWVDEVPKYFFLSVDFGSQAAFIQTAGIVHRYFFLGTFGTHQMAFALYNIYQGTKLSEEVALIHNDTKCHS